MTMDDLIGRLESATKGSRELDALIHRETAWAPGTLTDEERVYVAETYSRDPVVCDQCQRGEPRCPAYTTSLDAALTLMPKKEWSWKLVYEPAYTSAGPRYCVVLRHAEKLEIVAPGIVCSKETLPLAICIAVLKARAADTKKSHAGDRAGGEG